MKSISDDTCWNGWIQTFTGRQFFPANPTPESIDILDIAHALSMLCRFGGHCIRFYSVAEHCVLMARAMAEPLKSCALLHDGSEAYLVDMPRPIKPMLQGYREMEDRLQATIFARFGLAAEMPAAVKWADSAMLAAERVNLSKPPQAWAELPPPLEVELRYWRPEQAESEFLTMAHELGVL